MEDSITTIWYTFNIVLIKDGNNLHTKLDEIVKKKRLSGTKSTLHDLVFNIYLSSLLASPSLTHA